MEKSGAIYQFINNSYALVGLIVCAGLALLSRTQVIKDPMTKRWLLGLAFAGVLAALIIPGRQAGQGITTGNISTKGDCAPVNVGNSGSIDINAPGACGNASAPVAGTTTKGTH